MAIITNYVSLLPLQHPYNMIIRESLNHIIVLLPYHKATPHGILHVKYIKFSKESHFCISSPSPFPDALATSHTAW